MIHEFCENFLDLPLEKYTLTFDDGLLTQYNFLHELKKIKTKKIFFISGQIICQEDIEQNKEFITCTEAHARAFAGDYRNYMKWSQIKEINSLKNCEIGFHGFSHSREIYKNALALARDTRKMIRIFTEQNLTPTKFCFPFNYEIPLYRKILQKYNIEQFYGSERINVYDLLKKDICV